MNVQMKLMLVLIVALCWFGWLQPAGSDEQPTRLALKLSLQEMNPFTHDLIIQLEIVNIGERQCILPQLKEGVLEQYNSWWGWGLTIKNHEKRLFGFTSKRSRPLTPGELILLKPGEGFLVPINLARARLRAPYHDREREWLSSLIIMDGRYEVTASLTLNDANMPSWYRKIGWTGDIESNTVSFVLAHDSHRMYFPGDVTESSSPTKEHILLNVETPSHVDHKEKYTLYLLDTLTDTSTPIYFYDNHVEVLWSPQGEKVLMNPYASPVIFCIEQDTWIDVKERFRQHMGKEHQKFLRQKLFITGVDWLNDYLLKFRVRGYEHNIEFSDRYIYNMIEETFIKLK